MGNDVYIHSSAEVSDEAYIGECSRIWNQVQIREDARIGDYCNIGKNVYIDFGVDIGDRVKIQNNVSIFHGVTIEDDVFIGPSVTFTNDRFPRAFKDDYELGQTVVRKGASICANATIRCDVVIGEYATVAAGSVVTRNVSDHALVMGVPARVAGWVCECGRVLDEKYCCPDCGKKYLLNE